jgi:hypothetical protein
VLRLLAHVPKICWGGSIKCVRQEREKGDDSQARHPHPVPPAGEEDQHQHRIDEKSEGEGTYFRSERPGAVIGAPHVVCVMQEAQRDDDQDEFLHRVEPAQHRRHDRFSPSRTLTSSVQANLASAVLSPCRAVSRPARACGVALASSLSMTASNSSHSDCMASR